MNILILGDGFVGNHLKNHLLNHNVTVISRKNINYTIPSNFNDILSNKRYDIVVNCFGYTGSPNVDQCEYNKSTCWRYNAIVPATLVDICNKAGIPIIHISSGCIYEGNSNYDEIDTPNFGLYTPSSSFYSKSKHAGEISLEGKPVYILRIRMVLCKYNCKKNILIKLLNYPNITNNINSITSMDDLTHVVDVFCTKNSNNIPFGIYNVVNTSPISTMDIVDALKSHGLENKSWKVVTEESLKLACRRSNCSLSNDKLRDLGISMPNIMDSLNTDIAKLKAELCQPILEKV